MTARQRVLFCSVAAQADNLGDIDIRLTALEWYWSAGARTVVYSGSMPKSYLDAFNFPPSTKVVSSAVRYQLELLTRVLARRASIAFAPGPTIIDGGLKPIAKSLLNLGNLAAVRLSGGVGFAVGKSARSSSRVHRIVEGASVRLMDLYVARDTKTSAALQLHVEQAPDLAFWRTTDKGPTEKRTAVISLRDDRDHDLALVSALAQILRESGLTVTFVTQVRRDDSRHASFALAIPGAVLVDWGDRTHTAQMARVLAVYEQAAIVISDRLHALIFGARSGAALVALISPGVDKLSSTLDGVVPYSILDPNEASDLTASTSLAIIGSGIRPDPSRIEDARSKLKVLHARVLNLLGSGSE